jgi:Uma2 family endonuclease
MRELFSVFIEKRGRNPSRVLRKGPCYDDFLRGGGHMALHEPARKLTYEDYVLIPEDGKRHEIIGGEHFVTAAPFVRHQDLVVRLTFHLEGFVRRSRLGRLLVAPTDVVLSPHDIFQPDLLFVSNERASIITEKNIQGAPDLVIEILSKDTRRLDEVIKREAYERFGVREYWIFDRYRKAAKVWRWSAGERRREALLSAAAGDVLTTSLLPGFEIPLSEIFEE